MEVGWVKIGHFRRKMRYNSIDPADHVIIGFKLKKKKLEMRGKA